MYINGGYSSVFVSERSSSQEGFANTSLFLRMQVIFSQISKIKFEFLALKGSLEAFFSRCSQYFLC